MAGDSAPTGSTSAPEASRLPDKAERPEIDVGRVRRRRNPLGLVGIAVVLLLLSMVAHMLVTQARFQWGVVGHYLFSSPILHGVVVTIYLTVAAEAIGIAIGIVAAVMRLSRSWILARAAQLYTWVFRSIPTLVQLLLWYNLAFLLPRVGLGIPYGPQFISASPNKFMTPLIAALLGLGINEGAYMSEIVRAGLLSVNYGQREAASALGLTEWQQFRKVIFPQAMRTIIPPTGNDLIAMLKYTSLASVISLTELLFSSQQIYEQNFEIVPLLMVASIWYLAMTTVASSGQYWVERHFGRGVAGLARATRSRRSTRSPWREGLERLRRPLA